MSNFEDLWISVAELFSLVNEHSEFFHVNEEFFASICNQINESEHLELVYDTLWQDSCSYIRNEVIPKFWANFRIENQIVSPVYIWTNALSSNNLQQLFSVYVEAVTELSDTYTNLMSLLYKVRSLLDSSAKNKHQTVLPEKLKPKILKEYFLETMLACLPTGFRHIVYTFNTISFKVFATIQRNKNVGTEASLKETICGGCHLEIQICDCEKKALIIKNTNKKLQEMGILDRIAGQTITTLVEDIIREHISTTSNGDFDKSNLNELELWIDNVVVKWLLFTFNYMNSESGERDSLTESVIQNYKVKLKYFFYESFAHKMIEQFFNIIIDFPDSIPAIDDLRTCMEKIDLRKQLINSLKTSLEARILHPGVNTIDILTGYIAAIKAIRYLDNSGIILNTVTVPIKEYLRKRSDTVRRVVTGLTEEGPTDLSEELAKGEAVKENICSRINDEIMKWENWIPEPFGLENSSQNQSLTANRPADIISMVVDIYGSKELFMNEYRNLMADRLLTQLDFNPEKEIRNLELLKIRFGEALLHSCEVMLKDVTDSKRINAHIQSDTKYNEEKKFEISSLIISAQFWPSFNKESLELPEEIANEFQKYTKSYEAYKGNRTLQWRNVTGRVNIVIDLGEKSIEMAVPPTQAVIIYHFQHKNEWSLEDLSNIMKVPSTILRRRINFWQQHALLCEISPNVYKLVEDTTEQIQLEDKSITTLMSDDDDMESAMASASDQREEELQVFWSYIVGMLTNLDSLPLERIHQMLKLFASQGIGTEFAQDELKDFLQRKVREHHLIFSGGVYQLPK